MAVALVVEVAAGVTACGGKEEAGRPATTTPPSTHGLSVSAPTHLGDLAWSSFSLAATPAGDHWLALWWDKAAAPYAATIARGSGGVTASEAEVLLAGAAPASPRFAVFDGAGFTVATGSALQHLAPSGALLGGPVDTALDVVFTSGSALVATPRGLIVTWTSPHIGRPQAFHATLVAPDGSLVADSVYGPFPTADFDDPGLPAAVVTLYQGAPVVLYENGGSTAPALTGMSWFGSSPTLGQPPAATISGASPLLVVGDQLAFAMTDAQGHASLFRGPPEGPFTATWALPPSSITQAVDTSGRVVNLSVERDDAAQTATLVATSPAGDPTHVIVGSYPWVDEGDVVVPGPQGAAIVSTDAGYGVAWVDGSSTAQFAMLSWQ